MPKHYHCTHLIITDHACDRLYERFGIRPSRGLCRLIIGRLKNRLKLGAEVNNTFCVDVPLDDQKIAVCTPDAEGGWAVVTFERVEKREG